MTGNYVETIDRKLRAARRTEQVEPALHRAVLQAVSQAQHEEAASGWARYRWWPALGSAALASILLAIWLAPGRLTLERSLPESADPTPQVLAEELTEGLTEDLVKQLEQRLAQPLDNLQALQQITPLESELAALEADLAKMKPRWPWQPERPPAG